MGMLWVVNTAAASGADLGIIATSNVCVAYVHTAIAAYRMLRDQDKHR